MDVNETRNFDFRAGKATPRHWSWRTVGEAIRWERGEAMTLLSDSASGIGFWSQSVACKPDHYYRVEAVVTCDLLALDESAGLVLAIDCPGNGPEESASRVTPGLHCSAHPTTIRTYFHSSKETRRVNLRVGLVKCTGWARIIEVRFIRILEPDEMSHPLAVPPPASHYVPPRVVSSVTVCCDQATERPLTRFLSTFFGESCVSTLEPDQLEKNGVPSSDAIFLPASLPPRGARTLSALLALAEDRLVVMSLPAFSALARTLRLRRIEQPDDPIHAKVVFSDHATRGFALHDQFAYAWGGRQAGSFVQHQFRMTDAFKAFCKRHRFETLLVSSCDKDSTSDQPICLYRRTRNGGLFVLDVEPVEATASTFGEPNLAAHLLLSILGRPQSTAGQYCVPLRTEAHFREMIREAANRWEHFVVHDDDVPANEVTEQIITVGGDDQSYGLPLAPKPVILIRSGLIGGDVESAYGVLSWFRQLLRPQPNPCPYVQSLVSRFRLAWVPSVAPWEVRDGWMRTGKTPLVSTDIEIEGADLAAMIDVCSVTSGTCRIVFSRDDSLFRHASKWIPRIWEQFLFGSELGWHVENHDKATNRNGFSWRDNPHAPAVVAEPDQLQAPEHLSAVASGAGVVRIEVPGGDADFVANSIARTHRVVILLETVIGMLYGIIVVNRRTTPVHLDGFPMIEPGGALIERGSDHAQWESSKRHPVVSHRG